MTSHVADYGHQYKLSLDGAFVRVACKNHIVMNNEIKAAS